MCFDCLECQPAIACAVHEAYAAGLPSSTETTWGSQALQGMRTQDRMYFLAP